MTGAKASTLGPRVPPARGTQGGPPSVTHGRGAVSPERGTRHATNVTGTSTRQVDHWCSRGLLGPELTNPGNGRFRHFTDADLEVITALGRLSALGCLGEWLACAADAVRAGRVGVGEWLLLTLGRDARRLSSSFNRFDVPDGPAWLIPLTPFDQGHPR